MADPALITLNAELALILADYWHEIDFNGGRDASRYYVPDAEFHGYAPSWQASLQGPDGCTESWRLQSRLR